MRSRVPEWSSGFCRPGGLGEGCGFPLPKRAFKLYRASRRSHRARLHTQAILLRQRADISGDGDNRIPGARKGRRRFRRRRKSCRRYHRGEFFAPARLPAKATPLLAGGTFGPSFGRPAMMHSRFGNLIAFTNRNSLRSPALTSVAPGHLSSGVRTGTRTQIGILTYISNGRPGLLSDGTLIISGASKNRSAIFRAKEGKFTPIESQGDLTQYGSRLEGFVDPSVTSSGLVYLGGHDDWGEERLFVFESGNALRNPMGEECRCLTGRSLDAAIFYGKLGGESPWRSRRARRGAQFRCRQLAHCDVRQVRLWGDAKAGT